MFSKHDGRPRRSGYLLVDGARAPKPATATTAGGDAWAFSRRASSVDLSPLWVGVIALLAVARTPAEMTEEIVIY
jgi:hypothetical protein